MSVIVEMEISYFSTETGATNFIVEQEFDNIEEALEGATQMLLEEEDDAKADGALMDTFYYEYDFIIDQSEADAYFFEYECDDGA